MQEASESAGKACLEVIFAGWQLCPMRGPNQLIFFNSTKFFPQAVRPNSTEWNSSTYNAVFGYYATNINVISFDSSIKSANTAWLAQSVERETLRVHFLRKRLIHLKVAGSTPASGFCSFCHSFALLGVLVVVVWAW
jgi:hypothetical protein